MSLTQEDGEEDKKKRSRVEKTNQLDSMIYQSIKLIEESKDKLSEESVQALESMQRAGRHLTDAQKELIGLNPFHWIGEFGDPKQQAAFGTTAYAHFKQARKRDYEFNGMRDEFAIIGHLDSVVLKSQNIIVQQTQRLLDKIFLKVLDRHV